MKTFNTFVEDLNDARVEAIKRRDEKKKSERQAQRDLQQRTADQQDDEKLAQDLSLIHI